MRTYKHIICILTAIVSLIACSEAELEKLPYGTVSINATWSGDHPVYEVKIDEEAPLDVIEVRIFEEFTDNTFPDYYNDHKKHRWIKAKSTEAPYIFDDKYWTAYGNDLFEAYAKVITSTGSFISEKVSITYPTDNIIRIKNVEYSRYANYSSLILEGENFDLKATYKIGDTPVEINNWESKPYKLVIDNYLVPKSGLFNEKLVVNGKEYPFTFDYPVARIDSISKKEIEVGDTLVVYLKDCNKYVDYAFKNCEIIKQDAEKQRYTLLPICTKSGELDITPYDPMANIASYENVKIKTKTQTEWSKVTVIPDRISFIYEDKVYRYYDQQIRVYDINNGKKLNTYNWNSGNQHLGTSIKGMCASKDYIYIANGINDFPSPSYIDKINIKSGKAERVCEISADIAKLEYDGSNLFTWENNSNNIYKVNPSTGKYTIKQEPTDYDVSDILTMDNGYIYGSPDSYSLYEICRYKFGDKTSELLSKDGDFGHFLKVKGDSLLRMRQGSRCSSGRPSHSIRIWCRGSLI